MNAESFIKEKEITWGKPFSNWNRTAFKKALNEFADKHHNEQLLIQSVVKPSCGWTCEKCGETVNGLEVTFEETHDGCGGNCI